MDEILIDEKKYISSKRAAKITGYAKDYVGQLCREGRVPARLVGRSWYVLDTAIHDHRFGNGKSEEEIKANTRPERPALTSSWANPRYEAAKTDVLPPVKRHYKEEHIPPVETPAQAPATLQESWRDWFKEVAEVEPQKLVAERMDIPEKTESNADYSAAPEEAGEIIIPIRGYRTPPEALLPKNKAFHHDESPEERIIPKKESRRTLAIIRICFSSFAILSISVAAIGTGYFDSRISSYPGIRVITGVSYYVQK
ncbi:MAG: hypothetical protein WAN50_01455 [Minisyncoccia bacterium]